jgi:hypothetical protein
LSGQIVDTRREGSADTPHYQIHLRDSAGVHYRAAVNVLSAQAPSTVGLATLIINDRARRHVEMAGAAWTDGDSLVAMARLRMAFDQLVTDTRQKAQHAGRGVLHTRPWPSPRPDSLGGDRIKHIESWLDNVDSRLRLLLLEAQCAEPKTKGTMPSPGSRFIPRDD